MSEPNNDGWTGRIVEDTSWNAAMHNYINRDDYRINDGYTVYGHLTPSRKWYFGITKRSPNKRWGMKGQNYKSSPRFYSAIEKYGWNNIYHYIVGTGYSKEEACALEKALIKQYDALGNGGYNCTEGGDGLRGHRFSEESKKKMRRSHIGQTSTRRRPVWCVDTGQFFESCTQAAECLGIRQESISRVARGERNTVHGLHFAYMNETPLCDFGPSEKQCRCVETGVVYSSRRAAADAMGVSCSAIAHAVRNGTKSCGFHWEVCDKQSERTTKRHAKRRNVSYRKDRCAEGQLKLF